MDAATLAFAAVTVVGYHGKIHGDSGGIVDIEFPHVGAAYSYLETWTATEVNLVQIQRAVRYAQLRDAVTDIYAPCVLLVRFNDDAVTEWVNGQV